MLQRITIGLLSLALAPCTIALAQEHQRPYQIDDIFRLESVRDAFSFSADGRLLAFVVARAINTDERNHYFFANDRSDVWIYDRENETTINLTKGETDSASFWYPVWSPKGDKLVMVSSRGVEGGYHRAWVWDRASRRLTPVSDQYVDINNDLRIHGTPHELIWMSDSVISFRTLPQGVPPTEARTNRQAIYETSRLWHAAVEGKEPTAIIFESGRPIFKGEIQSGERYVTCNVYGHSCTDLLPSYIGGFIVHPLGPTAVPSPDRSTVAVLSLEGSSPANPNREMARYTTNHYAFDLIDQQRLLAFESPEAMKNALPGTIRWSPDGTRLAFVGSLEPHRDLRGTREGAEMPTHDVFIVTLREGTVERVSLGDLRLVPQKRRGFTPRYKLAWTRDNQLVVQAERRRTRSGENEKKGWWLLGGGAAPLSLTAGLEFLPDELHAITGAASFLTVGNGELWLVSLNGESTKLTNHGTAGSISILWTDGEAERGIPAREVVYRIRNGGSDHLYHVDMASNVVRALSRPNDDAEFATFSPTTRTAVFTENGRSGTRLWIGGLDNSAPKKVFETNTFLRNIAEGEVRRIHYLSLEGDSLPGWVILPAGYQADKRYPLITWVYQKNIQNDTHDLASIATLNPLNLQTLAARGYAVLLPSMPGKVHEYHRLLNGVIPAVDKVIEMGLADPDRVAVMGQSNGGFSTYGLITLTNRFKAAVAIAGMTDFFSIAMQFEPPLIQRQMWEIGVTGGRFPMLESWLGFGLPWRSTEHLENSPIMYVDRVQTPILLLHGDHDGVPIAQAEEFFTALQRLGKRAKFVRYIGEDHVFHSPANIRHSWEQIFDWLEEFLGKS